VAEDLPRLARLARGQERDGLAEARVGDVAAAAVAREIAGEGLRRLGVFADQRQELGVAIRAALGVHALREALRDLLKEREGRGRVAGARGGLRPEVVALRGEGGGLLAHDVEGALRPRVVARLVERLGARKL